MPTKVKLSAPACRQAGTGRRRSTKPFGRFMAVSLTEPLTALSRSKGFPAGDTIRIVPLGPAHKAVFAGPVPVTFGLP